MIPLYFLLIIVACLILFKATDILIVNLKGLSESTRLGRFAITSFLLALGTSLPEFFVSVTSALEGKPNFALGNVIGSNIADLSLVIGGAALVGGGISVRGAFLERDVFYAFLAGASPMLLLFDENLSRIDGLILLMLYGVYILWILTRRDQKLADAWVERKGLIRRVIKKFHHDGTRAKLGWIFLGIALLLLSADILVQVATRLAMALNIPILLVGLFIVAIGTSLPELAFELKAVRKKEPKMVFGNLLGSIVANGTLVIGLVALISPFRIQAFDEYLVATFAFVLIFGAFYFFIRTKRRLESWEGAFLIGFYLAFLLVEIFHP